MPSTANEVTNSTDVSNQVFTRTLVCDLSNILRKRRLTITQVANDTGIARQTISALRKGNPKAIRLGTVSVLCTYS